MEWSGDGMGPARKAETPRDLDAITAQVREFVGARDWRQYHAPKDLAISIVLEAAELLERFQWKNPPVEELVWDDDTLDGIAAELSDIVLYCIMMYERLDIDPATAIAKKLRENAKKYPVGKAKGKSTKYTKL